MKIRPGTDWATAPRTSPSCDTWRSTSCKRTQPRDPCAGSSSAPAGTTPTSPVCSPYSEVRLPWDGTTFGAWLDGIRGLTAEQRGQGFRALALAEAADGANPASLAPPTGVILMSSSLTIGGTPPGNSDFAVVRTRDVP